MNRDDFVDKYREEAGCENVESHHECWCERCCFLEKVWDVLREEFARKFLEASDK